MPTRVGTRTPPRSEGRRLKKAVLAVLMTGVLPGFIVFSAYLAQIMGEGKAHSLVSLLLLIIVPFAGLFFLVGAQGHRLGKTLALWGAFSWVFSLIVLVGAMEKTGEVLRSHGAWFTSFMGKEKRRRGDALAKKLVNTLPLDQGVPYRFEEGSIIVDATVTGGGRTMDGRFILDTGASISTISPALAARLGVAPSPGGPSVEVQTASGAATYPLVTLDALSLGGHRVGPLTAAVCGPCGGKHSEGLIGLNFASHFHLSINSKEALVKLRRRSGWIDQKEEIEPFVVVSNLLGDLSKDRFRISGSLTNSASKPMKGLVFECVVKDRAEGIIDRRRIKVPLLKPGTSTQVSLNLAPRDDIGSFQLQLKRGFW